MDEDIQGILDKYKRKLKENVEEIKDYKEISNILQDRNYFTKYAKEAIIYFGTYSCYSNKN